MTYQTNFTDHGHRSLCSYPDVLGHFRGPACDLNRPYIAYLGGAEVFGQYSDTPFPDLISKHTGLGQLNLAGVNAGLERYLSSHTVFDLMNGAEAVVIEITSAAHLNNPFYAVHPRRNDRIIRTYDSLSDLFPRQDFVNIHFIRHLLNVMENADAVAFQSVCHVLQTNWVKKMKVALARIHVPVHLIYLASHEPYKAKISAGAMDPLFIDQRTLAALQRPVSLFVQRTDNVRSPHPQVESHALSAEIHMDIAHHLTAELQHIQKKPHQAAELFESNMG